MVNKFLPFLFYYGVLPFIFLSSCHKPDTMFKSLSPEETHIQFENQLKDQKDFGILYYLYYYNGGGVAIGDINQDGLPDIYFTSNSKGGNKLYLNKGNFTFEDITQSAGVCGTSDWCTGVTMADVNGDGLLDIYVSAVNIKGKLKGHNELFINDGHNKSSIPGSRGKIHFTESAAKYGLDFSGFSTQAVFFDFDHDGDLDCYILNQSHKANENIVDTINRRKFDPEAGDKLMRNDLKGGNHIFTDISAQAGIYQSSLGYGLGISVADLNNDGWDDIYIGNDFHENDYYYINNRNGTFTESGSKHFKHYSRFSMGNDIADFNNDGQPDIITVDMLPKEEKTLKTYGSDENADIYRFKLIHNGYQYQYSKNCLQLNNGSGISFSDIGLLAGVSATDWSWCPLFADFDNDGNKDLFISSGIVKRPVDLDYIRFVSNLSYRQAMNRTDKYDAEALYKMPDGASHPFLFKGNGELKFTDFSDLWGTGKMKGYYNGAAYADLNNDGNLDLVINCLNSPALILKNNAPRGNSLSLGLIGKGGNTSGIGTKVYLFSGKKMQFQELMLTRGFESSTEARLHFGLGGQSTVDSLVVVWPDESFQRIKNLVPKPGKTLFLHQNEAQGKFDYISFFHPPSSPFRDISDKINIKWKHQENAYNDYSVQYLIPHLESTRGPKIAVSDVNKDGLDDFFVGGASGQPGRLMVQTQDGKFIDTDSSLFHRFTGSDQVDALFFDANGDGFPDLYVASGGNELENGNPALSDHLFLNTGRGHFTQADANIPFLLTNKSCLAVADFNGDGFMDLFIGGLADAKAYGIPQSSFLLLNNGLGHFTLAPKNFISLQDLGIVTSALVMDVNRDGIPDLIVGGEWMPLTLFLSDQGHFKKTSVAHSSGLWQTLYKTDINGDGLPDILAGNWGNNSKLYSGKESPLKLYVKDFDKNGSIDQIMAYTLKGKEYPFLAKDELERALPVLKKAYLTYDEVAGKSVQFMLDDLFKDYRELTAETLNSCVFLNDGKGGFKPQKLPENLQFSPIFSFLELEKWGDNDPGKQGKYKDDKEYLALGNFYGVVPYEGRYDALFPSFFSYSAQKATLNSRGTMPSLDGEFRDAKWLRTLWGKKIMILSRNNRELVFLQKPQLR